MKIINYLFKVYITIKKRMTEFFYSKFYSFFEKIAKIKNNKLPTYEEAKTYIDKIRPHQQTPIANNIIGEKEYDLTVIIPVYNAEKYISKCLDSIFSQETKYTYLVKTINDGSTDNSLSILKEYQKEHDNLQITTIQNSGAGAARNEGLKQLNSDYVYFIDADDTITTDCFELLLKKAYSNNYDIVEGEYVYYDENKIYFTSNHRTEISKYSLYGLPWNKVIKSSILKHFCFPIGYCYEDTADPFILHQLANSVSIVRKVTYNYLHTTHIQKINDKSTFDSFLILYDILHTIKELQLPINHSFCFHKLLYQITVGYERNHHLNKKTQKTLFVFICNLFDKNFKNIDYAKQYNNLYQTIKNKDFNSYLLIQKSKRY